MDISPATVKRHWTIAARLAGARAGGQLAGVNPDRWQQINELFHADARAGSRRRATRFCASARAGDPDLHREVRSLLAATSEPRRFPRRTRLGRRRRI